MRVNLDNEYFEWLYDMVCAERYSGAIGFRKLLKRLHDTEFIYIIDKDANRASDGMNLRYRFAYAYEQAGGVRDAERYLIGPCSVLEMMIALSLRCEETIMNDPRIGNRTGQWFWKMVVNLGLGPMRDDNFDIQFVDRTLERFLHREYAPNGAGGLFTVPRCEYDLRKMEIWFQLCRYLDSIMV